MKHEYEHPNPYANTCLLVLCISFLALTPIFYAILIYVIDIKLYRKALFILLQVISYLFIALKTRVFSLPEAGEIQTQKDFDHFITLLFKKGVILAIPQLVAFLSLM